MIISKIQGGLGNQLFCYFASYNFINSKKFDLLLDIYDYKFYRKDRPFYLEKFKINYKIATKNNLKKFRYLNFSKIDYALSQKFSINLYKKSSKNKIYLENNNKNKNLEFHRNQIKDFIYVDGFWQDFNNLKNIKNFINDSTELKEEYINFDQKILNKIKNTNSISIHVRRDDLLRKPFSDVYHTCNFDYYKNSINFFENKTDNNYYFIFTDDIVWAKKNLNFLQNKIFISDLNLSDYSEFYLMKKCKHHIISNSTFSLWAAWISENINSLIITPKYWYKKSLKKIHPENWIEINNT